MSRIIYGFLLLSYFLLSLLSPSFSLYGLLDSVAQNAVTETSYNSQESLYITDGYIELDVPLKELASVASDFKSFDNWALFDINGTKEEPKDFISLIRSLQFIEKKNLGMFIIGYDIDLIWPFGSTGNEIGFSIDQANYSNGQIKDLHIGIGGYSTIIKHFLLKLGVEGDKNKSIIRFHCETRLASFIDLFLSLSVYKKNIEWRVIKVIKNLRNHVYKKRQTEPVTQSPNHQVTQKEKVSK